MQENYQVKRVLNEAMKNREIGSSLGLEKKQGAVLDIIKQQGIKTDLNKLPGYKREEFLKAVKGKIGIGYEVRKAFQSVYGERKCLSTRDRTVAGGKGEVKMNKIYDEIISKRKNSPNETKNEAFNYEKMHTLNFAANTKNMRASGELLNNPKTEKTASTRQHFESNIEQENSNIKDILKKIQS